MAAAAVVEVMIMTNNTSSSSSSFSSFVSSSSSPLLTDPIRFELRDCTNCNNCNHHNNHPSNNNHTEDDDDDEDVTKMKRRKMIVVPNKRRLISPSSTATVTTTTTTTTTTPSGCHKNTVKNDDCNDNMVKVDAERRRRQSCGHSQPPLDHGPSYCDWITTRTRSCSNAPPEQQQLQLQLRQPPRRSVHFGLDRNQYHGASAASAPTTPSTDVFWLDDDRIKQALWYNATDFQTFSANLWNDTEDLLLRLLQPQQPLDQDDKDHDKNHYSSTFTARQGILSALYETHCRRGCRSNNSRRSTSSPPVPSSLSLSLLQHLGKRSLDSIQRQDDDDINNDNDNSHNMDTEESPSQAPQRHAPPQAQLPTPKKHPLVQLYLELPELIGLEYYVLPYDCQMDLQARKSAIRGALRMVAVHRKRHNNNNHHHNHNTVGDPAAPLLQQQPQQPPSPQERPFWSSSSSYQRHSALHLGVTSRKLSRASIALAHQLAKAQAQVVRQEQQPQPQTPL